MGKDYYTLLVVPEKKSSIRKIRITNTVLRFLSIAAVVGFVSILYLSYDYLKIRNEVDELSKYKYLAENQKEQIALLAGKISRFEKKMADVRQLDKKIRIMTNHEGEGQFLGMGGPIPDEDDLESQINEKEKALIDKIHENIDQLLEEATSQENSLKELLGYLEEQKSILASTPSIWPVRGWVSSEFGYRLSPFTGKREFHRGIDIATGIGKEIVAPASGMVTEVSKNRGMGNTVRISHSKGVSTCYGHLLKFAVKKNQKVKRGDVIGYVGNSGRSTGSHLHYSVLVEGVHVNPRRYFY